MTDSLRIRAPDDWHLHLRDGARMAAVVAHSARQFRRAIVMPNLNPPVTTVDAALAYRARILECLPANTGFDPLMTLYLTDATQPGEIDRAADSPYMAGCKLYPAGATTNSDSGVTDMANIAAVLERMAERDLPLLVHGELSSGEIDIFDRELDFIDVVLHPLCERLPSLRIVFEHVTTAAAVAFVRQHPQRMAATITPQHLLLTRNDLLAGGLRPHHYCLPVLKTAPDREALLEAACSGDRQFFLGTDSAPHARVEKERACGCAGVYSAHAALELYAAVFDAYGALDKLEAFASLNGPDFYRLPHNEEQVELRRAPWTVPQRYDFADQELVPFFAGRRLDWRLA